MFMLSVWFENIACYAVRKPLRLQVFFITVYEEENRPRSVAVQKILLTD